ncbi:hypothetical protein [Mycobacterium sp.]|uniref:hypothetical protein n=1 Tax=Mycobacterium sp. TaxID=1785 RepID=UPI003D12E5E1
MRAAELERYLEPTLSGAGFKLDGLEDPSTYQNRPAWVIFYQGQDCKLQISWSARDGGIDYLLAPLDAPNEFGLSNKSKKWHLMLMLSNVRDDLITPAPDAASETEMSWLKALFEIHFDAAHAVLLSEKQSRSES